MRHENGQYDLAGNWDDLGATSDEEKAQQQIAQVQTAIANLEHTQKQVDRFIDALPKVSSDYVRLSTMRDESRGWFDVYVVPAWKTVAAALGVDSGMGFVNVLLAMFMTGGLADLLGLIDESEAREKAIINDPAFQTLPAATQAIILGQKRTWLSDLSDLAKYSVYGLGLVVGIAGVTWAYGATKPYFKAAKRVMGRT